MEKKYIIYKVSGGLCHMLREINNTIHLSILTNRYLIIDCNAGAFNNDFNRYFYIPNLQYTTSYDCLYLDSSIKPDIFKKDIGTAAKLNEQNKYYVNDKLATNNLKDVLENTDKIIYSSWVSGIDYKDVPWYIKVNEETYNIISKNKIKEKYVGIHYRNTPDKQNNLSQIVSDNYNFLKNTHLIYFATDDYNANEELKNILGSKFNIIQYTKPIKLINGAANIHYSNPDKNEIIINALIDLYHLTKATYFIPSINSSFSKRILELRKNDKFFK